MSDRREPNGGKTFERAVAVFLTRTMAGFVYFFSGVHQIATGAALTDAVAAVEIAIGALLLAGFRSRPVLRGVAVLLVAQTLWFGIVGLSAPGTLGPTSMDIRIVNFYILPRAVLVIVTLFIPAEDDVLSLDALVDGRLRRLLH
jgi:hypothetical protein